MYAIYGNMDPINIPQMSAYIYHTWILWDINYIYIYTIYIYTIYRNSVKVIGFPEVSLRKRRETLRERRLDASRAPGGSWELRWDLPKHCEKKPTEMVIWPGFPMVIKKYQKSYWNTGRSPWDLMWFQMDIVWFSHETWWFTYHTRCSTWD